MPTTAHGAFAHAAMHSSSTSVNSLFDSPRLELELLLERLEHLVAAAQHARDVRAHPDRVGAAGLAAEHRVERRDAVDVGVRQVERRARRAAARRRTGGRAPSARGEARRARPAASSRRPDTARTAPRSSSGRPRRIRVTSGCCLGRIVGAAGETSDATGADVNRPAGSRGADRRPIRGIRVADGRGRPAHPHRAARAAVRRARERGPARQVAADPVPARRLVRLGPRGDREPDVRRGPRRPDRAAARRPA